MLRDNLPIRHRMHTCLGRLHSSTLRGLSSQSPELRQTTTAPFVRPTFLDPRLQVLISVPLISRQVKMKVQTLHLSLSQEALSYITKLYWEISVCTQSISI